MNKKGKYVDYGFLLMIGLLIVFAIYKHIYADFILSVNNYLGLFLFAIVCSFKLLNIIYNKYLVFVLLVLYSFNIINFTVESFNMNVGFDQGALAYNWPSINPLAIIFLIVYLFLNGSVVRQIYTDNEEEAKKKFDKKVSFYYNKFRICSESELTEINKSYNNYPEEARSALDKIRLNK